MQTANPLSQKILFGVLLLLLLSFFLEFRHRDLWSAGEARAALIAERMNPENGYLVPTMPEGPSYAKPPLYYWLVALGPKDQNGRIGAYATRLPSVLSALLLVCLIAYLGERWVGPQIGYFAAIILCTNLKFFWMARVGRIDMLLTLFIVLTLVGTYWTWKFRNQWGLFLASTACALGTLAKGPIALFLPGLVMMVAFLYHDFHLFRKNHFLRTHLWSLLGAGILYFLMVLPWYILVHYHTHGEFTQQFLFRHNLARFMGSTQILENVLDLDSEEALRDFDTSQPPWYMIPRLFGDFFPWSLFLPSCLYFFWKSRTRRPRPDSPEPPPFHLFCGITALTIFLFFSLSSFKRGDYILPIFPPLALVMAYYWKQIDPFAFDLRWIRRLFLVTFSLFFLVFAVATLFTDILFTLSFWKHLLKETDFQNFQKIHLFFKSSHTACFVFLGFILLTCFGFFWIQKRPPSHFCLYLGITTGTALALVLILFFPYFDQIRTLKPFVQQIHHILPKAQPLFIIGRAYDFNDLHYHLQCPIYHIENDHDPLRGYQLLQWTSEGTLQIQWTPTKPSQEWENQQWMFFFQLLQHPKQHFFLIREKDLKKIPPNIPFYRHADNKESARRTLLLISNFPPPK